MPAHPDHIERRETLVDLTKEQITVDFYTNGSVSIYRGEEDEPETRVWLHSIEKKELHELLQDYYQDK